MSDVELRWPGKYDAAGRRVAVPRADPRPRFTRVERHAVAPDDDGSGEACVLALGDNLRWLDTMADRHASAVDLVYMDPPFCTGKRFTATRPVGDEGDSLALEAYDDTFRGGLGEYLAMLDPRLRLVHKLLAPHGSVYVHVDANVGPAVKLMLDEIFGPDGFQREIVWRIGWVSGFKTRARNWIRNHDCIYFYAKDPGKLRFNKQYVPHPPGYQRRDGVAAKAPGIAIDDVWNASEAARALSGAASFDSIQIKSFSREKTGWATQKNASLLRRIIAASSDPGDLVMDPFGGSGTTAVAARALGRRFAVCDRSELAVSISRARLLDLDLALGEDPELDVSSSAIEIVREPHAADAGGIVVERAGDGTTLVGFGDDQTWPEAMHARLWSDRVEAWGLADDDGRVCFEAHRRADRALALDAVGPPAGTRVFVWDVLGRRFETRVASTA